MSRFARVVLILMLAAIPLRGMTGVIAAFCKPLQQGAGQTAQIECDGHVKTGDENPVDGSDAKCGHCSACSIMAPLVSEAAPDVAYPGPSVVPVSFLERHLPARFPERLERPPLAL